MRTIRVSSKSGFTLFEVLIAASMTMIVMFGALYTTTESFEVAREGDRRIQSKVSVRRSMDRFLKDCRYAQDIAIQGDLESGWEVTIATAGSPEPMELSWKWNP
ncbi:MAG: prepilin-type N-terminal cleavage/methylation domain-containing protein, partial [Planctomycetota bacterium]|nr:prepilin-type N-terminal cleavage/methylation domain-containing protein [Planctomycetota bacterium]